MTEGHGDRLGDLTDDVHGRHDDDGFGKALEPAEKAVVFDVIEPHEHRGHQRPGDGRADVRRRAAEEAQHTDERAEEGRAEQRADVGREPEIVLAHGVAHHVIEHLDDLFHQDLSPARALFQVPAEAYAQDHQGQHDEERGEYRFRDRHVEQPEKGERKQNFRAGHFNHCVFSPFFILRNSSNSHTAMGWKHRGSAVASGSNTLDLSARIRTAAKRSSRSA